MESDIISLRRFLAIVFLSVFVFAGYFFIVSQDKKTKLVFCDVGQGDAAYIRVKNKIDVLVDAGPDRKVLSCLGKYMPFWDRKIELAIVSHPQKDHFGGFLYLLDRYQIEKMLISPVDNPSQSFKQLKEKISQKKIRIDFPKARTKINILNDRIDFYWPKEEFIAKNIIPAKAGILGVSTLDDNNFSLIFVFQEGYFRAFFTGDATPRVLNTLTESDDFEKILRLPRPGGVAQDDNVKIDIVKIPHHGSKNGLTKKFLQLANPTLAVISVGKNNSYGHPAKEVLDMLKAQGVKIKRTDDEGDIVFKLPLNNF